MRVLTTLGLLFCVACSGSTASVGDATDSGADAASGAGDEGGPADSADATACLPAITNGGEWVTLTAVADDAPLAAGGPIANGDYYETARTLHTGSGGEAGPKTDTERVAIRVRGPVWQYARAVKKSGYEEFGTATVTVKGTSLVQTIVCPPPGEVKGPQAFTATESELRLYGTMSTGTTEVVLTRQ